MASIHHQTVEVPQQFAEVSTAGRLDSGARTAHRPLSHASEVRVVAIGDTAFLVEFADHPMLRGRLLAFRAMLEKAEHPGIIEVVIGLKTVLVHCEPDWASDGIRHELEQLAVALSASDYQPAKGRHWQIPICYDPNLALDLEEVAAHCGLTTSQVARLHSEYTYTVSMIGFMPGQPYLTELPEKLQLPRRLTPRTSVIKGSVAIAANMTVVYPIDCPAGWHIIGRTPVELFNLSSTPPARLAPGDTIRFASISRSAYDALETAVQRSEWRLEPEGSPP